MSVPAKSRVARDIKRYLEEAALKPMRLFEIMKAVDASRPQCERMLACLVADGVVVKIDLCGYNHYHAIRRPDTSSRYLDTSSRGMDTSSRYPDTSSGGIDTSSRGIEKWLEKIHDIMLRLLTVNLVNQTNQTNKRILNFRGRRKLWYRILSVEEGE